MRPFRTLLLESFRGLKSQLIFWITLGLSLFVALIFLSIGFDDEGPTFFFGLTGYADEDLGSNGLGRPYFYKDIFSLWIAGVWLTWIATILALISCAPIFPNTMTEGGAGMVMTKGVSRLQIFTAKLVGSLFFVLIQVGLFVLIVFVAFKWRLGEWHPQLFWYIPAVLLVFVGLYSFLVLVAVKTRSVLTALLLTFLVWGISGILGLAEEGMRGMILMAEKGYLDDLHAEQGTPFVKSEGANEEPEGGEEESSENDAPPVEIDEPSNSGPDETLVKWHGIVKTVHSFLPKNGPVMDEAKKKFLLADLERLSLDPKNKEDMKIQMERDSVDHGNSSFYTIWSSVLFAAVMLSLAAFSFCRRDY